MSVVLGVDLGTGSMKGLLLNDNASVVSSYSVAYETAHMEKGYSEQNPKDWINAFNKIIDYFIKEVPNFIKNLEAISFSGQMHSLVLLDNQGNVLRPSILWNDVRNTVQSLNLTKDKDVLLSSTYNLPLEGFTLPKILWVQENEPEVWSKVKHILLPKDYLRFYLNGEYHTDYSDAAGTLLLNLNTMQWDKDILDRYNINEEMLPTLLESDELSGNLKATLKSRWNFHKDIKLYTGGADNACSAIGSGVSNDNIGMLSIGTSGVILAKSQLSDKYQGKLHLFAHVLNNQYYKMGVTLSAGSSLDWIKSLVYTDVSYNQMFNEIKEVPIGARGLIFAPYLSGERSPYSDGKIRGSFIGLDISHSRADLTRAVIEGITFSLYQCFEIMDQRFDRIISVGGGAKSEEWLQIQADIFNLEIVTINNEEGPGFGAALIAAKGAGWYTTLEDAVESCVKYQKKILPNHKNVEKYQQLYFEYKKVYNATKNISHELQSIEKYEY